jgi:hypothetical protein
MMYEKNVLEAKDVDGGDKPKVAGNSLTTNTPIAKRNLVVAKAVPGAAKKPADAKKNRILAEKA